MNAQQKKILLDIIELIREAVREAGPLGLPEGTMYSILMAQGCTINQFENIIALMVRTGAIHKQVHLLTVPELRAA
jgi:hypothetical protein